MLPDSTVPRGPSEQSHGQAGEQAEPGEGRRTTLPLVPNSDSWQHLIYRRPVTSEDASPAPRPVCPPTSPGGPPGHTSLDGHLRAGALLSRSLSEAGPPGAHGLLRLPWSWSPQGPLTTASHPRRLLLLGAETAPPPPTPLGRAGRKRPECQQDPLLGSLTDAN